MQNEKCLIIDYLLGFMRAGINNRTSEDFGALEVDWDLMMSIASEQGILAWVWDGLTISDSLDRLTRLQRINWNLSAQEIWKRSEHQKQVLLEIVDVCGRNSMRVLLLKGNSLASLYQKPQSRPSGDIDIYLFEHFEKGNRLLGSSSSKFQKKHSSFDFMGVHVENHKTMLDVDTRRRRRVERYLEESLNRVVKRPDGFYVLDPLSGLVYLVMHTIRHFGDDSAAPIRAISDVGRYLEYYKNDIPPESCENVMKKMHMSRSFCCLLYMVEWVMRYDFSEYRFLKIDDDVLITLKKALSRGGFKNVIPSKIELSNENMSEWGMYFKLLRIYSWLSMSGLRYCLQELKHLMAVIIKRMIGKPPKESVTLYWK